MPCCLVHWTNLYDHWQTMQKEEKREIVEVITGKIIVGKDGIIADSNFCLPPGIRLTATPGSAGIVLEAACSCQASVRPKPCSFTPCECFQAMIATVGTISVNRRQKNLFIKERNGSKTVTIISYDERR